MSHISIQSGQAVMEQVPEIELMFINRWDKGLFQITVNHVGFFFLF
jgi:hypothetical protein